MRHEIGGNFASGHLSTVNCPPQTPFAGIARSTNSSGADSIGAIRRSNMAFMAIHAPFH
jgi:hypothetical protein